MDNAVINSLALDYAMTGGEQSFDNLYIILKPIIRREARKREFRTGIDREEFESVFMQALWEASQGYNGDSNFMQRLHFWIKRKEVDVYRYHQCEKRDFITESIDNQIDEDGNTYADVLPGEEHIEANILSTNLDENIKKLLAGFSTTNEQQGLVIHLLAQNCTTEEIARKLGANEYDARIRKVVQRARSNFRKYVDTHSPGLL